MKVSCSTEVLLMLSVFLRGRGLKICQASHLWCRSDVCSHCHKFTIFTTLILQRETTPASERGDQVTSKTIYFVFYVAFANSIGRLLHSHWLYQGSCKREGQRWRSLRSRSGCCWSGRRRRTWLLTMDSASTGRWIVQSDFQCFLVRHIDICSMAYNFWCQR